MMIDPDWIDLAFYGSLAALSTESVWWWIQRYRSPKHALIVGPALLSAAAITIAAVAMATISATLVFHVGLQDRLYWNPIVRRIQGIALFGALASHWWWRRRT